MYVRYTENGFGEIWHGNFDLSTCTYGPLSIVRFHQKSWRLCEWLLVSIFYIINILSMLDTLAKMPT